MDNMEMIDVSETNDVKQQRKKDKFIIGIYISLIVLIVLGLLTYFCGYELLKPFIEV